MKPTLTENLQASLFDAPPAVDRAATRRKPDATGADGSPVLRASVHRARCPRCGQGPLPAGDRCGWCGYRPEGLCSRS